MLTGAQMVAVEMENLLCEEVEEQQMVRSRDDCASHFQNCCSSLTVFCYPCSFVDDARNRVTVSYSLAEDNSDPDGNSDLAYPDSDLGEAEVLQTGDIGA